jgi:hypothetical protein
LQQYPRLGGARGTAFNYLAPLDPPEKRSRSGLEDRLRLKLGLTHDDEEILVIEHILLRPTQGDEGQEIPLLGGVQTKDPYSLQLTFAIKNVVHGTADPYSDDAQDIVEKTIRAETPAHLTPWVMWVDGDDWTEFKTAYDEWLADRRAHVAEQLGVALEELEDGW